MKKFQESGFTLIELLVITPVVMVTITLTMSYLFDLYGQLTTQGAEITLQNDAQIITFSMQDDIFFARGFLSTKNSNLTDTYAPSGGWTYNSTPKTLIVSTLATTASHRDPNRAPVYIDTLGCSPDSTKQQNEELQNNVIYFASGTNLYKRVLTAPSSLATCGTSFLKQNCPSEHASSTCPADILLTDRLASFQLTYYDSNNAVTTTPESATKVQIALELKDRAYAEDVYGRSSITIKRLNQ